MTGVFEAWYEHSTRHLAWAELLNRGPRLLTALLVTAGLLVMVALPALRSSSLVFFYGVACAAVGAGTLATVLVVLWLVAATRPTSRTVHVEARTTSFRWTDSRWSLDLRRGSVLQHRETRRGIEVRTVPAGWIVIPRHVFGGSEDAYRRTVEVLDGLVVRVADHRTVPAS